MLRHGPGERQGRQTQVIGFVTEPRGQPVSQCPPTAPGRGHHRATGSTFQGLRRRSGRGPSLAAMSCFVDRAKRYLLGNFENIFVLMTLLSTAIVNYLVPAKL